MSEYLQLLGKLRIHPTLWIVIGIAVVTAHFISVLMLLFTVLIHELGHAIAAQHFKWRIKSISLLPFGGSVETEEYGNKSLKEDCIVILAGPLQHLWLIGSAYLFYSFSIMPYELYQQFLYLNLAVMVFNLLPIWPLDGGKLLFLGLSLYRSFIDAHRFTLLFSIGFAFLSLLLVSFFQPFNLNIWIISGFLAVSLSMEWKQRYYAFIRFLLERHYGRNVGLAVLRPIRVEESVQIHKVLEKFQRGCKHPIIILKNGKERGSLDENEILHAYFSDKLTNVKIGDLLYSY
ncbi:stage IV sporulation protein FB [Peribacillus cavernae]|uniref:Stage IV sporulation protein FB n=1 Tax=Peribacillus cavernae TaxID=1674310 RepID=A0A433HHF7_9BACI|nr:M50 family metallopeptidase [Peribacillus cavernae]MDQ0219366.1 stage IV sporulation protein FB [Peribacillus cavernae]RUQ27757.1 stage IV sporulation protein FB [Peribacillus cavernae]